MRVCSFPLMKNKRYPQLRPTVAVGKEAPPVGLNKTSVAGKSHCATLAGRGRGRPAGPGPAQAWLPGVCATARSNHARPPRPAASGKEPPGPQEPWGTGEAGRGCRARDACGVWSPRGPDVGPTGREGCRPPRPLAPSPTALPSRGLRSPLSGRPQP